jgi:cytidine diphosphoramidate kinase
MTTDKGMVFWITGISGVGKTTISNALASKLRKIGPNVIVIDGDIFRETLDQYSGFTILERLNRGKKICAMCKFLSDQGIHVVCATICGFNECQEWNRANISRYFEILITVERDVLYERDPKGLYSKALNGLTKNVYGIDLPYQAPSMPEMIIDNSGDLPDLEELSMKILSQSGFISKKLIHTSDKDMLTGSGGRM